MHKLTRISYNSAGWRKPTGDAQKSEIAPTYNRKHGFGHEDWLFRSEWLIDGWRYAFIQGVNKSHAKLVKAGQPFDLTLFTIQHDKKRRYVATIHDVECLDDQQAEDALKEFKRRGWHDLMQAEIRAVGGNPAALGAAQWAKHVLNVRFRLTNVSPFPANTFASAGDPALAVTRYQLTDFTKTGASGSGAAKRSNAGSPNLPNAKPFKRTGSPAVECTPEHARMQAKLMKELQVEYPKCQVVREQDFIDVSVQTETELLLFEIKSDLEPRTVIRQALGQILEYAFHPSRHHALPLRLVIVGRRPLSPQDSDYLDRLKSEFRLPLGYRFISSLAVSLCRQQSPPKSSVSCASRPLLVSAAKIRASPSASKFIKSSAVSDFMHSANV